MRIKKAVAVLLTLCLCIGISVTTHAAGMSVTVDAPEALPGIGETFEVTVSVAGNPGLSAVQLTLAYDQSVLECTDVSQGPVLKGSIVGGSNPSASGGAKLSAVASKKFSGSGVLGVYTFKVLDSGSPALQLKDVVLQGTDGTETAYTIAYSGQTSASQPQRPSSGTTSGTGKTEESEKEETDESSPTFTDVPDSYWASAQIERAADMGLITGYADGSFRPGNSVTRAQFVTMLWRMAGKPSSSGATAFTDIGNLNSEFKAAIAWAAEKGVVNGVTTTLFQPNATITRQQAMTILFRYNGGKSGPELLLTGIYNSQFKDSALIGAFARPGVYWAVYNGIVNGVTSTTIVPNGTATRAQIAVIFLRYMDKFQ